MKQKSGNAVDAMSRHSSNSEFQAIAVTFVRVTMLKKQNPVSFHIIENESKQNQMIWTYPTISDEIKTFLLSRCFPVGSVTAELFFYLRKKSQFHENERTKALVVTGEDLAPAKYRIICDILTNKYVKTTNPVDLVKLYLNLITSGTVYQENGTEIAFNLKSYKGDAKVKGLLSDFGLEVILLYNAILLKKRILVYHYDIQILEQSLLAITNLVLERNPDEYLYPLIQSVHEMKDNSFYLAGTTEEYSLNHGACYDLYVNLVSKEIIKSKEAKEFFVMTKIHKDLAHVLVQLSKSELSESEVIEEITKKTNDILKQLCSLATHMSDNNRATLSVQDLKAKKFNPDLEKFLYNLAVAQNIMSL
ncbi:hypothetical protein NQ318_016082 [Aromia moschata]|uniref:Uncharacterized protein n=1 Tax=Aromia moschata TaxID=1265417 RepID=A0AAV8XIS8_9CUCU|nr:hypothetical protein NQ318_016082 [Aromia moschata]